MIQVLGVCKALKALHQYKVGRVGGGARKAKAIRSQAVRADQEAAEEVEDDAQPQARRKAGRRSMDTEQEPLMEDELTTSQDGVAPGQLRAYAHRDIKPGEPIASHYSVTVLKPSNIG